MIGRIKSVGSLRSLCLSSVMEAGVVKGNQKYRCKNCGKNQAETAGREKYTDEERSSSALLS